MPTQILQIHRQYLKTEDTHSYRQIEDEITRLCVELGCPHPYLGLESLTGPKEVWYFNSYESAGEIEQRARDYASNVALRAALTAASKRKADLLRGKSDTFTHYRRGGWKLGEGRFLVIAVVANAHARCDFELDGTRFEAEDGSAFHLWPAETRAYAEALASRVGSEARVFAVRPEWSFAAEEWRLAEPMLWSVAAG